MDRRYECRLCGSAESTSIVGRIRDWEYRVPGSYEFRACRGCGQVQIHPFPTLDDLRRAYDIDYHGYAETTEMGWIFHLLYTLKERRFEQRLSNLLPPKSRVLDVGCGNGRFLERVRRLGADHTEGIDFDEGCIRLIQSRGMAGFVGTFSEFPENGERFDMVAMNNYLEHTLDPRMELKKARRLLKSNGYLVGEVPGFDSIERCVFGRYWGGNHVPRHTFQFDQQRLESLLTEAGFEDVLVTHELNTGHWALSVQNWLQRKSVESDKPSTLKHGRAWYYPSLLVAFIPINVFCVMLRKAGVIKFFARSP